MGRPTSVLLDTRATEEDVEKVGEVLQRADLDAPIETTALLQGADFWLVVLEIGLPIVLQGPAIDGWEKLKEFCSGLRAARGGGQGQVIFRPHVTRKEGRLEDGTYVLPGFPDPDKPGIDVTLSWDLPNEAYQDLFDLDWNAVEPGPLYWDYENDVWMVAATQAPGPRRGPLNASE